MERLVESVHAPCPNAAYGCAARPAYYDRSRHRERPCSSSGQMRLMAKLDLAVDEAGFEREEITLSWHAQTGVKRDEAVKALKENDGDLLNTIMSFERHAL
ncbi:hypothetical protein EJB05_33716, partial [Eragrostis curvula]